MSVEEVLVEYVVIVAESFCYSGESSCWDLLESGLLGHTLLDLTEPFLNTKGTIAKCIHQLATRMYRVYTHEICLYNI